MGQSGMEQRTSGGTSAMQQPWGHQTGDEMRECIQNCLDCHASCLETVMYCLGMGGKHAEQGHIRLLLDCVQICATSADFMLRGSDLHALTCEVCAEVCERCAEDCKRLADSDEQMLACAEMCRRCAESCRRMARMM